MHYFRTSTVTLGVEAHIFFNAPSSLLVAYYSLLNLCYDTSGGGLFLIMKAEKSILADIAFVNLSQEGHVWYASYDMRTTPRHAREQDEGPYGLLTPVSDAFYEAVHALWLFEIARRWTFNGAFAYLDFRACPENQLVGSQDAR